MTQNPTFDEWVRLGVHTAEFEQLIQGDKIPRNVDWRVNRLVVRNVYLGVIVTRFNSFTGLTEFDFFGTYDPDRVFVRGSGTRISTLFALSEAFKNGGTMEIMFTKNHGKMPERIPQEVVRLAHNVGVDLQFINEGHISATEARRLYLLLTDLSPEAKAKATLLHNEGRISLERTCYMVNNQTWLPEEADMILLGAKYPERVLLASTPPHLRQLFMSDLFQTGSAILGSYLSIKLRQRETVDIEGKAIDVEDDDRRLDVSFDARFHAKKYHLNEHIPVPWLVRDGKYKLASGSDLVVMPRPRTRGHIRLFGDNDLQMAAQMASAYKGTNTLLALMYPEDFSYLTPEEQDAFINKLSALDVKLIVCPELMEKIDSDSIERLANSRTIRR